MKKHAWIHKQMNGTYIVGIYSYKYGEYWLDKKFECESEETCKAFLLREGIEPQNVHNGEDEGLRAEVTKTQEENGPTLWAMGFRYSVDILTEYGVLIDGELFGTVAECAEYIKKWGCENHAHLMWIEGE